MVGRAKGFKCPAPDGRRDMGVARSPQRPLEDRFFSLGVNFDSCPSGRLATISGLALGEALNLLWLGRKNTIFRKDPACALWISGNEQGKCPAALDFGLVSARWLRVEQKQNKPSQNGQ